MSAGEILSASMRERRRCRRLVVGSPVIDASQRLGFPSRIFDDVRNTGEFLKTSSTTKPRRAARVKRGRGGGEEFSQSATEKATGHGE